jgi:hypothetical protein
MLKRWQLEAAETVGVASEPGVSALLRLAKDEQNRALRLEKAGDLLRAEQAMGKSIAAYDSALGGSHLQTIGARAFLGKLLLAEKTYADAEPILSEVLAVRRRLIPESWQRFNGESMLGEALLGQARFAAAETLLLSGHEGLSLRREEIPQHVRAEILDNAARRLAEFYEATGRPEDARHWREQLHEP